MAVMRGCCRDRLDASVAARSSATWQKRDRVDGAPTFCTGEDTPWLPVVRPTSAVRAKDAVLGGRSMKRPRGQAQRTETEEN